MADLAQARTRYVNANMASRLTDGLLAPKTLRTMARAGLVPGAVRVPDRSGGGWRYFFDTRGVVALVEDLTARPSVPEAPPERPFVWHDRRAHTLFDSQAVV